MNEDESIKIHRRKTKWNKGIIRTKFVLVKQKCQCTKLFFKQFSTLNQCQIFTVELWSAMQTGGERKTDYVWTEEDQRIE